MPNNVTKKEYILKGQRKKRKTEEEEKNGKIKVLKLESPSSYPKHFDPTGWACNSRLAS